MRREIFTLYFVYICLKYTHMHVGNYEKNVSRYSATRKKSRGGRKKGERE